ncbi:hypothetical protein [Shewanella woodyi]|uniref:hypothetical protein n=1 Tax=Shewanella woodyi TaxID=60961 RepID=UPI0007F918E8|nr:hypothetical protein [Shewanella woodyi]
MFQIRGVDAAASFQNRVRFHGVKLFEREIGISISNWLFNREVIGFGRAHRDCACGVSQNFLKIKSAHTSLEAIDTNEGKAFNILPNTNFDKS